MDNFLDHLVARSWQTAEVVQPRPVSLFEPWREMSKTAVPPFSAWDTTEEAAFSDAPTGDEMIPTRRPSPRPLKYRHPVQLLEMEPVTEPIKETAVPGPQIPPVKPELPITQLHHLPVDVPLEPEEPIAARLYHQVVTPLPVRERSVQPVLPALSHPIPLLHPRAEGQPPKMPLPVTNLPRQSVTAQRPETKQPENRVETRREVVEERVIERLVVTDKQNAISVPPIRQVVQFQESSPPTAVLPGHVREPENNPKHEPVLAERFATTIQPQIRPFVPPISTPSTPGQPETTPTIHVTIGRIEVRATPAPTVTNRKERPQSSVIGLEEYLRRRNGGQP